MDRNEIIIRLKGTEPQLRDIGVAGLYLFGSFARDEMHSDSDVDLFVDKLDPDMFGFEAFMTAYGILQQAVPGKEISYTTREGLVDFYRDAIETSAIRIF